LRLAKHKEVIVILITIVTPTITISTISLLVLLLVLLNDQIKNLVPRVCVSYNLTH